MMREGSKDRGGVCRGWILSLTGSRVDRDLVLKDQVLEVWIAWGAPLPLGLCACDLKRRGLEEGGEVVLPADTESPVPVIIGDTWREGDGEGI
jgi:hypothetical protein